MLHETTPSLSAKSRPRKAVPTPVKAAVARPRPTADDKLPRRTDDKSSRKNDNANSLAKVDKGKLPHIDSSLVEKVEALLYAVTETTKPATKKARLLALIVQLDRIGRLFPTHQVVADHVGCSVDNIRTALNDSIKRKLVQQELVFTPGKIARRQSTTRRHRYVPTKKLLLSLDG